MKNWFKHADKTATSIVADEVVEMPTRFTERLHDLSTKDLENIYTGGKCYQLALALHDMDPDRFVMWEIRSRWNWDRTIADSDYSAHWVVEDKTTGKFVDAYGSHESMETVLDGWDDFEGDTTTQYHKRSVRSEAVRIMNSSFGIPDVDPTFTVGWREDALYTVKALGLI